MAPFFLYTKRTWRIKPSCFISKFQLKIEDRNLKPYHKISCWIGWPAGLKIVDICASTGLFQNVNKQRFVIRWPLQKISFLVKNIVRVTLKLEWSTTFSNCRVKHGPISTTIHSTRNWKAKASGLFTSFFLCQQWWSSMLWNYRIWFTSWMKNAGIRVWTSPPPNSTLELRHAWETVWIGLSIQTFWSLSI